MDTKIINAYNERTQKLIASDLLIVDAAAEPLRVLKVLVEGLPHGENGLWLNNFKGIPVARTLSPFDLIYLDPDYYVVHCVEISRDGEYEPFRGEPASALVVPPRAILTSKLRAGDRLLFRAIDPTTEPAAPAKGRRKQTPASPPGEPVSPHFYNSAFPVASVDSAGGTLPGFIAGQSQGAPATGPSAKASAELSAVAHAPVSGRLGKTANSLLDTTPAFRPSAGDDLAPSRPEISMGSVAIAPAAPAPVDLAYSVKAPTRLMAPELVVDTKPAGPTSSGRLLRTVNLAPAILPAEDPQIPAPAPAPVLENTQQDLVLPAKTQAHAVESTAAQASPAAPPLPEKVHEPTHGIVIPFTSAPVIAIPQSAPVPTEAAAAPAIVVPGTVEPSVYARPVPTEPPIQPAPTPAATSAASDASMFVPVAMPEPAPPVVAAATQAVTTPPPLRIVEAPAPAASAPPPQLAEAPAVPSAADAVLAIKTEPSPYPRTQIRPVDQEQSLAVSQKKKKPSWDVRLLYTLFPEFNPARPPEIRIPRIGEKEEVVEDEEELPTKLRLLCWLYPDLQLDKHKQRRREERRAVRLPMPGLVAYFFTGGSPRPHPIKDISLTGFYMITNERWLPGTIIRVTLQMINPRSDGGRDSVTVHSRVVRWGADGGGFEFVLPGFLEQ